MSQDEIEVDKYKDKYRGENILKDLETVTFTLTRCSNRAANITLVKLWVWTWHISTTKAFKYETLLPLDQKIGTVTKTETRPSLFECF